MKSLLQVGLVLALVAGACGDGSGDTAKTSTTATGDTTVPITTVATTLPSSTTTAPPTTLPPVEGTSLADVVSLVQAELDIMWSSSDQPPGVLGPFLVTCANASSIRAEVGDVFACPGVPQTDGTVTLDAVGVVMMVVTEDGSARWLSGTDIPDTEAGIKALYAPHAGAHFCRELREEGGHPFDLGYLGAVLYWFMDGMPDRMDADRDGVPCETVFSYEEVLGVWQGTARQASLENPRDAFQFAFVADIAADGSSVTLDYAEFLTGDEADEAAVAAGDIPEGERVPNDYYIRNVNPRLRTFPVAADATIDVIGYFVDGTDQGLAPISMTPLEWATLYAEARRCVAEDYPADCADLGGDGWFWYGGGSLPYWLLIENDTVVSVEEQYLP